MTYLFLGHDVHVGLGAVEVHVARDRAVRVHRYRLILVCVRRRLDHHLQVYIMENVTDRNLNVIVQESIINRSSHKTEEQKKETM